MSTEGFIRLETAEGGIEYWDGSTKIAFINDSGTVQATRGNADRKDDLLPWIAEKYPVDLGESAPENEPETGAVPSKYTFTASEMTPEEVAAIDEKGYGAMEGYLGTDPEIPEKAEHSDDLSPNGGQGDPDTREQEGGGSSAAFVHETKDSPLSFKVRDYQGTSEHETPPVCPFPGNSQAGSKSPEVVAWWFDNHPELARVKYAKHKHLWPSQP